MSDFDKEAEREKLRKKFAKDRERREATQRMSDLLLKGATMTNAHCEECGSPLFTQDGQTFCPTCQEAVDPAAADGAAPDEGPTDASDAGEAAGSQGERVTAGTDRATTDAARRDRHTEAAPERPGQSAARTEGHASEHTDRSASGGTEQPAAGNPPGDARAADRSPRAPSPATGDLADAREALVAALTRHARMAAETDDPRRASAHLEAAREAAEALAALDR